MIVIALPCKFVMNTRWTWNLYSAVEILSILNSRLLRLSLRGDLPIICIVHADPQQDQHDGPNHTNWASFLVAKMNLRLNKMSRCERITTLSYKESYTLTGLTRFSQNFETYCSVARFGVIFFPWVLGLNLSFVTKTCQWWDLVWPEVPYSAADFRDVDGEAWVGFDVTQ